ncbi:ndufa8, NADH-ubiquinone oxidoreductase complex I 19kd subunit [Tilletia horrida]|uniref:NADH-ubiquinone oxidoreductase n=1 Tax=Tilletia horrida TaxID=155126 RepID=A0AAN6GDZ2_9BASI|nr:ndufa8, NADH-ubiquinone oxidoreductase complex I 19kd subunit [Tilletia horrida]KAK0536344.1 ndufa8, NADH-ubiquinone oxidoreductase complex I 19kd subunit [Tilletia horrida]KAK0563916.1 ndufa8, NADH-ubiquinone oxidoreductase complex I 19kd subunit [Tilletia horrida]
MATHRDAKFPSKPYIESAPVPAEQGGLREVGATSAPLKSASFFIGEACKAYNEDFMLCKNENADPAHCLKEGRRVTRCAQDLIRKLSDSCGKQWEQHWQCLENNNQEFYKCRKPERSLNQCVFDKLNLAKKIPGSPEGQEQVHELKRPVWH